MECHDEDIFANLNDVAIGSKLASILNAGGWSSKYFISTECKMTFSSDAPYFTDGPDGECFFPIKNVATDPASFTCSSSRDAVRRLCYCAAPAVAIATDSPTMAPTSAPTGAPTAAPTIAPTGAPTAATVTGDPHVTNVEGGRFNLARVGVHVLLRLPRSSGVHPGHGTDSGALLEVLGTVESERSCAEPFVKQLDLSGRWLRQSGPLVVRAGGQSEDSRGAIVLQVNGSLVSKDDLSHDARLRELLQVSEPAVKHGDNHGAKVHRNKFFAVQLTLPGATLTVEWVHREVPGSSLNHLDFHVAGLPKLEEGMDVGGILGRDDHTFAASPSPDCAPAQNLLFDGAGEVMTTSSLGASYKH